MQKSFGECLFYLLELFKINGSKLAKGINIDQSLVYKWMRNERIPAYHSPYIELIVNYLTANMDNPYHEKNITEFLLREKAQSSDCFDMVLEIRNMLYEAQSYSLEQKRDASIIKQETFKAEIAGHAGMVTVIKGFNKVIRCAIMLLAKAPVHSDKDDTIFVTFNSNASLVRDKDSITRWKKALAGVLSKGWKVSFLVSLNDNVNRTLKILRALHAAFGSDRFNVYYKKVVGTASGSELIIVPQTGALVCFSTNNKDQPDSGFLFQSEDCREVLTGHFYQLLASAKPLFIKYPRQVPFEYQKLMVETEEHMGDRFVYNGGHAASVPYGLYKKYLQQCPGVKDVPTSAYLQKRRLDAFNTQVKIFKFKDIWFKETIEKIVLERKYVSGHNHASSCYVLEKEDIVIHIENIIQMLRKYKNYEIAIINQCEAVCDSCWTVKSTSYVLVEGKSNNTDINLAATEQNIVAAYREFFLNLWNDIPHINKDKDRIITWLKSLLEKGV